MRATWSRLATRPAPAHRPEYEHGSWSGWAITVLSERQGQEQEAAEGEGSLRLCIATRTQRPPEELIRFVPAPDGSIVPDLARRLPGRGVWVTATREAVTAAVASKAFAKSLKRQVAAAPDLPDLIERLLVRRVTEAISLANKAGQVVTGFTKVDAVVAAGEAIALMHGSGAAADGRQKLDRKLAAVAQDKGKSAVLIDCLTIDELSLAIGRENVVHAALRAGGAAQRVIAEAERLMRYRSGNPIS